MRRAPCLVPCAGPCAWCFVRSAGCGVRSAGCGCGVQCGVGFTVVVPALVITSPMSVLRGIVGRKRTTHNARRTTHDARRTTHDARRTTHPHVARAGHRARAGAIWSPASPGAAASTAAESRRSRCNAGRAAGRRARRRSSRARPAPARAARRPARSSSGRRCATCSITFSSHSRSTRASVVGARRSVAVVTIAHVLDVAQPVVDQAERRSQIRRPHAAAAVVAADDDVLDLQHVDGVLQHREAVEVGVDDDVGDVAVDEQLAGQQADDLVGRHAAVRAADPQVLRRLLRRERR